MSANKNPEEEELINFEDDLANLAPIPQPSEEPVVKEAEEKKESEKKAEAAAGSGGPEIAPVETQDERDKRSVFVKNVHYAASQNEIQEHFLDCGEIDRVTIIKDKYTKFCYIEFKKQTSAQLALEQSDSLFKGRALTVLPKRKCIPGMGIQKHPNPMEQLMAMMMGRGRGRGRGGGRGGFRGGGGRGGYVPRGGGPPQGEPGKPNDQ